MDTLSGKHYQNTFAENFEGEQTEDLRQRQTPGVFYCRVKPTTVKSPALLAWSAELAEELAVTRPQEPKDLDILAGNLVTESMKPYSACYGGHQFGSWAGQLGDGRAITLGEWMTAGGQSHEFQLKGAGPTPYSRRADGRAVLRSSLREYLMSEAMHHLGVPTTRALSLVTTGEPVLRDMFYDGRPAYEPGAIVMRVAPSFLRFGNFEILAARNELQNLKKLTDWTIDRFYGHIEGPDRVLKWFREIVQRTAQLMVEWLRVGFVHGVMNTDNMSVLGLTIDYGPFSFLDEYDLNFTPNTTDLPGRRYAFGQQAAIGYWNLGCLANAIAPLFEEHKNLSAELEAYSDIFWMNYYSMKGKKLGLDEVRSADIILIDRFEKVLNSLQPDMTIFYRLLTELPAETPKASVLNHFKESFYKEPREAEASELFDTILAYQQRLRTNRITTEESTVLMRQNNPQFVLRNYLLHQAIGELTEGKTALFEELQQAIKSPYTNAYQHLSGKKPDWAIEKAGCSMLSCSS